MSTKQENLEKNSEEIKKIVRERYASIVTQSSSCCTPSDSCCAPTDSCCGSSAGSCCAPADMTTEISRRLGYSDEELGAVPDGSNLGLGCGNPVAIASLKKGEVVLDLGSGAGFDCFISANQVGEEGKVIGVDMTPEMIDKARENAVRNNYSNVEFRLGEIENIPAPDNSVDVVISNCVINLSPDKEKVFKEAFRVLQSGGRVMVSDIVLLKDLPETIKNSMDAYAACIAGAIMKDDYLGAISKAGFKDVEITSEIPIAQMDGVIASVGVRAIKP